MTTRRAPRPTVMFAIPTLEIGGAERVFVTLLRHIDPAAFDLKLAVGARHDAPFFADLPDHVEIMDLGHGRTRTLALGMLASLRRRPVDIVMSTIDHLNIALCALRPMWRRDTRLVARATSLENLERPAYLAGMRMFYRGADAVIFQSAAMQGRYDQLGVRRRRSLVINNPVDVTRIRALAARTCAPRQRDGHLCLVAVGRLVEVKGFDILIRALARMRARPRLDIIGDGPQRAELEQLIYVHGLGRRVRLLGFEANPYPHIVAADGFVLPSRSEGFPNTVLESLALGVPVVATPVAGIAPLLARAAGCHVAAEITEESLAEALDRFCAQRPRRGSPSLLADFDATTVARRYEDLFDDLLSRPVRATTHAAMLSQEATR